MTAKRLAPKSDTMTDITTIETTPFADQKPGTSGLRKKVAVFKGEHYLENFVQSVIDVLPEDQRECLVVGGDGRYHNVEASQAIIRIAAANGIKKIIVGQNALLSTPAASCVIRKHKANGGIVLSASHNPGGPNADFGIKFNNAAGAPAPEKVTDAIFRATTNITRYYVCETADVDLTRPGKTMVADTQVEVIDPVDDYAELMTECFDFERLAKAFADGRLSILHDAMHAITGPYARRILTQQLGAGADCVINGEPLEDFGGGHPDPNLVHAKELVDRMFSDQAPVIGAASDGDGDRNLILGKQFFVTPSDSLAILTANAHHIPQFRNGLKGVARSMPTSSAVDAVARSIGIECYVTPTGWKFFGSLLDADRIQLCGEESFGTGGNHVREKDGLWTELAWLSVVEALDKPVAQIVQQHWATYGRNYYCRHDFEAVDSQAAGQLMQELEAGLDSFSGRELNGLRVSAADSFAYTDPVDASTTEGQGIQIHFEGGSRCVFRLSGTGTEGATIRLYLERFEPSDGDLSLDAVDATSSLLQAANTLAKIQAHTGRDKADVIT